MSDPSKTFWQDGLDHPSDELQNRKAIVLDLAGFMVPIPEADGFPIIAFDSPYGDGWADKVFGQVLGQSFVLVRHFSFFDECDKTFGIFFPGPVDIPLDIGIIRNLFSEHGQEVELPFSVKQGVWDKLNVVPCSLRRESSTGEEDMEMWVIICPSTSQLENDDCPDIEVLFGACFERINQAGISRFHDFGKEVGVFEEVFSEEIRCSQDVMSVCDMVKKSSSYEVGPCIGISFCTGQTEAGFTRESDASIFATVATSKLGESHFIRISTVQHFLNNAVVVIRVELWVESDKWFPMIPKYLLKCIFVNMFHGLPV